MLLKVVHKRVTEDQEEDLVEDQMTHKEELKVGKVFTDSSQKLKETGLTICLKMRNKKKMDYSIVTLSNHSNILII